MDINEFHSRIIIITTHKKRSFGYIKVCKEGRRYIYAQEFHRYLVSLPYSSSIQGDRLGNRFLEFGLNYIHLYSSDGIKMFEKV